jgi:hypothetical protein
MFDGLTSPQTTYDASVLADQGRNTGSLYAKLAMELINHARNHVPRALKGTVKATKRYRSPDFAEKSGL